jgi:hypothetical protein
MRGGRAAGARAEGTRRVMRDAVQDGMAAAREAMSVGVDVSVFYFPYLCYPFLDFFCPFFACECGWRIRVFCVCARACACARA